MSTPLEKKILKLFGLFKKFSYVQTLKRIMKLIHLQKNYLKTFGCFEHFLWCILRKIIMNTPSKKFFEVVRLVSKIFLGVDSERVMSTHLKTFFEVVWLFRTFSRVQNLKRFMNTPSKKIP